METINSLWGVDYKESGEIVAIKTPSNEVYPANGHKVFECDTKSELDTFIIENNLYETSY